MKQGWEIKKLGDVLKIQNGYAFDAKLFTIEKGTPLIRIRDIKEGVGTVTNFNGKYDKKYEVNAGDFLIGMDGEFGCYEWKGDTALLNQRVCRLQEFSNKLHSRFLFYGINKYLKAIEDVTAFATVKHISSKQIENIEIPLPPLPEQQLIVAILDEAFSAIEKAKSNAEQNLKNAKELFESYLQGVFENKGEGWEEKMLKEIGIAQTGTTPKTADKGNYGDFIPFIKPADIDIKGNGEIRCDNDGLSEQGLKNGRKMLEGSILMVCIGATIGKVGFVDRDVSCNQQINSLTVNNEFSSKFIYYALSSKGFFEQVILNSAQATLPIINKGKWETLTVSFPKSKIEQEDFANKFNLLQIETKKLEAINQQKLNDLEELKKSVLQKAFSGELKTAKALV
jgi:type I restriction enzyme S subunit